ncbi:MAG: SDR family NAD(P)-dependent oxidoreductase [Rhodothermales bacterium]|nr:SDR family NAD(P)-dependent oxidoreductase [Rhodothermales bacterium]
MTGAGAPQPLALITGASSGIGEACARRFAAEGYRVALMARSADKVARLADELGEGAVACPCDAADGDAVLARIAEIREAHGPIDVVVNSAGSGAWKRVEETPPSEALEMMGAPYQAAFNTSHAVLPDMLSRRRGVLIHVGSPASLAPWPASAGYAASRWALRGLNEALNMDLHGTGVRSSHVVFGRVDSAYFSTNAHAEERMPRIGGIVRTIPPSECANVILRVAGKPRREVYYPFMLRLNFWLFSVAPWLTRWLLRTTGHRLDPE